MQPFKIQGNKLLCDLVEVHIAYVYDNDNENSFDDLFVEAFSYLLASKMAVGITGELDLMQTTLAMYKELIDDAAASSINESKAAVEENRYVDARW